MTYQSRYWMLTESVFPRKRYYSAIGGEALSVRGAYPG